MLGKLLKHEFRATGRVMLPVLGVLLILAGLANLSFRSIDRVNSEIIVFVLTLFIIAFFAGMVAAGVMAVVVMIERFYKNLLKDEGYLMHTLPVSVHGLVWSKLIVSCVWFLLTDIVILAAVCLTVINFTAMDIGEIFRQLPPLGEAIRAALDEFYLATGAGAGDLIAFFAEFLGIILLSGLCTCLHFYAAMALGHSFSNNKLLMSVLFFIGLFILLNIITAVVGAPLGMAFDTELVVDSAGVVFKVMQTSLLEAIVLQVVQSAILYAATTLSMKKALNLG